MSVKISGEKDFPPLRNPEIFRGVSDLTQLSYLHEPAGPYASSLFTYTVFLLNIQGLKESIGTMIFFYIMQYCTPYKCDSGNTRPSTRTVESSSLPSIRTRIWASMTRARWKRTAAVPWASLIPIFSPSRRRPSQRWNGTLWSINWLIDWLIDWSIDRLLDLLC